MDNTLWKNPEKKFKPRNKQAALICIKAKPFFQPPEEVPPPKMAEPLHVKIVRENAERERRVAALRAEEKEAHRSNKEWEKLAQERQRILKVIRTTISECEQKGRPIPASVEELRKKLAHFPKRKKK